MSPPRPPSPPQRLRASDAPHRAKQRGCLILGEAGNGVGFPCPVGLGACGLGDGRGPRASSQGECCQGRERSRASRSRGVRTRGRVRQWSGAGGVLGPETWPLSGEGVRSSSQRRRSQLGHGEESSGRDPAPGSDAATLRGVSEAFCLGWMHLGQPSSGLDAGRWPGMVVGPGEGLNSTPTTLTRCPLWSSLGFSRPV